MDEESPYLERDTPEAQLKAKLLDDLNWIRSNPNGAFNPSALNELSEQLREASLDDPSRKQLNDLLRTAKEAKGSSGAVKAFIEFFLEKLGVNLEKALQKPAPLKKTENVQDVIERIRQRESIAERLWEERFPEDW